MSNEWTISSIGPMAPPPSGITSAQLLEHNLQAYVELSYIRVGNEVMAGALSDLETALTQTQSSLNSLATLQKLHNQLAPPDASKIPFDFEKGTQDVVFTQTLSSLQVQNPFDEGEFASIPISLTDHLPFFTINSPWDAAEVLSYYATQKFFTISNPLDDGDTATIFWDVNTPTGTFSIVNPGDSAEHINITASVVSPGVVIFTAINPVSLGIVSTFQQGQSVLVTGVADGGNRSNTFAIAYGVGTGTARTVVQNIHVDDLDSYMEAYNKVASTFYGTPLDPIFKVTIPKDYFSAGQPPTAVASVVTSYTQSAFTYYFNTLVSTKHQISGIISYLSTLQGAGAAQHGLLDQLHTVYNDIPILTTPQSSFSAVRAWLMDGYNIHGASGVANQGNKQTNITAAITASESLNDSQKESVRNYMFIFEEYYKSAAATLTAITQMIQKMAQNISR